MISLKNLAIYWNSGSELVSDLTDNIAISQAMNDAIIIGNKKPSGYKYSKSLMDLFVLLKVVSFGTKNSMQHHLFNFLNLMLLD